MPRRYEYKNDFARRYYQQGYEEGFEEGYLEGWREVVLEHVVAKLGGVSKEVVERIATLDVPAMRAVIRGVVRATSVAEVYAALYAPTRVVVS